MVGLYPNIPHEERIDIMRVFLNGESDKPIITEILCKLATNILKKIILNLVMRSFINC